MSLFKHNHEPKHDYYEIAIYTPSDGIAGLYGGVIPKTIVLLKCRKTGTLDTVVLPGKWTLEQVRGHAELDAIQKIESDLNLPHVDPAYYE
ncbi:MAG: hypothetical protein ABSG46_20145 [Candidatus Binataceae bacterium]|jgi:hypothetical protein